MAMLSEMGINVIESEDADERREEAAEREDERREAATRRGRRRSRRRQDRQAREPTDRTDDPVRMYLREMGSVELLSREGEIAIAKRIEAGREAMIAGLCESPLTFQAIIIWRDELNDGKVLLRDIIDLEATYAGPDAKKAATAVRRRRSPTGAGRTAGRAATAHAVPGARARHPRRRVAPLQAPRRRRAICRGRGAEAADGAMPSEADDDDDLENDSRLSAMEAELKPQVLETFDRIADNYKKLRRLQDQHVAAALENDDARRRRRSANTRSSRKTIIADVKSLSLNNNRIEALVEQLYDINKRLMRLRGPADAPGRELRRRSARTSSSTIRARSSIRTGSGASRSSAPRAGRSSSPTTRTASRRSAARSMTLADRDRARDSANSATSSTWCRRASARPARRRRRWSRRTCASSSRSPRNTPTAACSSST